MPPVGRYVTVEGMDERSNSLDPGDAGPTDETLVRGLRSGDGAFAERLVAKYHQPLLRYLHRLSGSEHSAEELLQQTWLSALDHIDRFDERNGGNFKSWLFRIATNKANDLWRGRGRERAAHAGLRLVTDDELPHAAARLEDTETHVELQRAIERLPEAQKQVLLLRYYSGLKFNEIAEMLGCPLNTALGRMHKAVLKLRSLLGVDGRRPKVTP
jgi:RNA polymerase sigma-70 factor, ECF subfamily